MKNVLKRIFAVFMVCIVLFTSTGFGLVEHSCSMKGKKSYSFISQKACSGCSIHAKSFSKNAVVKKSKCHSEKTLNDKVDFSQTVVSYSAKFINAATIAIYKVFTWLAIAITSAIVSILSSIFIDSSDAALAGKSLLVFVQSFLI